ncbi:MAG: (2Fe-2S) ferredoxin domain-containing protein [Gammaproteobacteria bacterium]|nr:(2Fe-2S) ferredoxin domain-containing protein [Gammaproteobacteria bacterium]
MTQKSIIKPKMMHYRHHLSVCVGPRCTQNEDGQKLYDSLKEKFELAGLDEGDLRVKRSRATCFGACKGTGPLICVQPDGVWYYNVNDHNMDRIITGHLINDKPISDLVFHQGSTNT